jgi:hypothetical protein
MLSGIRREKEAPDGLDIVDPSTDRGKYECPGKRSEINQKKEAPGAAAHDGGNSQRRFKFFCR